MTTDKRAAPVAGGEVRGLVAKWRGLASRVDGLLSPAEDAAINATLGRCADDLERALGVIGSAGREAAERDAETLGTGFTVDGVRVDPSRVEIFTATPPQAQPSEDADFVLRGYGDNALDNNGCHGQAIKALTYIAEHGRAAQGGEQFPNAECCAQIADELGRSFRAIERMFSATTARTGVGEKLWISVNDRLPTEEDYGTRYCDDDVIVRYRYTNEPGRDWDVGTSRYDPDDKDRNGGWGFGSCSYAKVSHWMRKDDLLAMLNPERGEGGEGGK